MLMPPPMLIAEPLINAASSETRKTMSPGDVLRLLEAADGRVAEDVVEMALREGRAGAGCLEERRRNVDAGNAPRPELVGDRSRETKDGALAGHVVGEARGAHPDCIGTDVDDLAPALRRHRGDDRFGGQVGAIDIDGKTLPPVGQRQLVPRLGGKQPGVVDQRVNAAIGIEGGLAPSPRSSPRR